MTAAAATFGTGWPMTRRSNSCTSAPRMRRLTTCTSAGSAAAMSSMRPRSSPSMPMTARWPGTTRPHPEIAGTTTARRNWFSRTSSSTGERRQVLMQAAKNGFYYVLDRATGELLSAHNFAFVSWTQGIDPKTGRPIGDPSADYDRGPALLFPSEAGAHSWQPMAYDAAARMTFIPVDRIGQCAGRDERPSGGTGGRAVHDARLRSRSLRSRRPCARLYGALPPFDDLARGMKTNTASRGVLRAWSVAQHRVVWEAQTASSWDGGVLATGSGLVFQGDANGIPQCLRGRHGPTPGVDRARQFDDGRAHHLSSERHAVHRDHGRLRRRRRHRGCTARSRLGSVSIRQRGAHHRTETWRAAAAAAAARRRSTCTITAAATRRRG